MIWNLQDPVDNYYFILRGKIKLLEQNPAISYWQWAHKTYLDLKKWKEQVMNVKINKEIMLQMVQNKLTTDVKQVMKLNLGNLGLQGLNKVIAPKVAEKKDQTYDKRINISIRMMDGIRKNYHQAKDRGQQPFGGLFK